MPEVVTIEKSSNMIRACGRQVVLGREGEVLEFRMVLNRVAGQLK